MTKEEAIEHLRNLSQSNFYPRTIIALDMAIEALSADAVQTVFIDGIGHFPKVSVTSQNLTKPHKTYEEDLIRRLDALKPFCIAPDGTRIPEVDCDNFPVEFSVEFIKKHLLSLPSAEPKTGWIPFTKRPLTDEEKEEYPDWIYIFDCPLPDDEQEILLSNGKYVWTDTFINDGECYLDGGDDIDEGMAWMPLPEPYREDGEA